MKSYNKYILAGSLLCSFQSGTWASSRPNPEAVVSVFCKFLCAPSTQLLATMQTFETGDLVVITHGPQYGKHGKVLGSYKQLTQKDNSNDVLEDLKKNPVNLLSFFMSLMPMKDRKFMKENESKSEDEQIACVAQELSKKNELLDANRLYKIEYLGSDPQDENQENGFQYQHVSCLKMINQTHFHQGDSSDSEDELMNLDLGSDAEDQ